MPDEASNKTLVKAEFDKINEQFYKNFDTQYFIQKSFYLSALIQNPHVLDETIKKGVKFKKLSYSFDEKGVKELFDDKFINNLKLDIALNYYHATETLFRLIFAHSITKDSPWVEVSLMTSFREHKKNVEDFINHKYFKNTHEEGIALIFYGVPTKLKSVKQKDWDKSIKFISDLLDFCGKDLLESFAYNSYKHGLAIFGTEFGFSLGELLKVDKDDSLVFLTHEEEKEKPGFFRLYKNYMFTEWETKFALTHQLGALLDNLISVGRWRFSNGEYKTLMFNADLMQLLRDDDNPIRPSVVKESSIAFNKAKK